MDLSRFNNSSFDRGASRFKEALWVLVRFFLFASAFPLALGAARVLAARLHPCESGFCGENASGQYC